MRFDAVVLGAGLAGLVAARDLHDGGADVLVLEARGRAGGRVMQHVMPDGRLVQLGGEVVGAHHTSYRALVAELGLTLEPAFPGLPGAETSVLVDGRHVIDDFGWMSAEDRAILERYEEEFSRLAATVDPDDPWSHPDAARLDRLSVASWLRSVGATPAVLRARELAMAALAAESIERTSLLSDLRKEAVTGKPARFYDYDTWESERVAEGSATVAARLAEELAARIRYETPVASVRLSAPGCTVTATTGEQFECDAVISSLPAGPFRDVHFDGLSRQRTASMHAQRHAIVSKVVAVYPEPFWEAEGQNGSGYFETGMMGGTWSQRRGILSALIPPERHAVFAATAASRVQEELVEELAAAFGERARHPQALFIRRWGADPWTQGYITAWRPGDVMAVGPLHGTHEPPLYLCGSDQWVCGYMEGAVRTGRAAAAAALAGGVASARG